jgi:D-amino-acid dehydrogenase
MTDVIVVGAGVVGLSAALELARSGHGVTVLDRGSESGAGCSWGNAGMIVPSHFVPLASPGALAQSLKYAGDSEGPFAFKPRLDPQLLRWMWLFGRAATRARVERAAPLLRDLHMSSRAKYEDWAKTFHTDIGLATRGLMMLCKTDEGLEEEARTATMAVQLGVPAQVLTRGELEELEPGIRMDVAGGVYFPKDAHLSPALLMPALAYEVRRAGATIRYGTAAEGFCAKGRRIHAVRTGGGDVGADEFVLAAGAYSVELARSVGLSLPLQAGKGYSLTLADPPRRPAICALLIEARVAMTPMGQALRFAGTFELTGLDERVDPARVKGIVKSIPRYLPDFAKEDFAGRAVWCGLRPCSPDGLPYVGRFGRFDNLTAATGHAMMGVSAGPMTGQLVAEIVSHQTPTLPIGLLSPDRFS